MMKLDTDWTSQSAEKDADRDSGCPDSPYLPSKVSEVPKELLRTFPHTKRVGNYLLGRTLGEGSFAKVKEGLHTLTGEKVAVKVIDKKKAREDAYVRKNLRREGRLLQQVRNRYVVQLYEIMETENSYYLVMELCEGGDLMDLICSRKKLDEKDTRRFIRQVVCAVDYLHKAGILHRDLKIENLLLDSNKDIKIIDFGLSNAVRVSHTKEGSTFQEFCVTQCGSPAYAAPELLGNKKYGPKVDVWSIGVNMFAMLAGNLPFTVEPFNIKTLHNKMLNGDMNTIPDHVSANCRDLLRKFLVADPDKRITLKEAMEHPWLTEGRKRQPEVSPFPNKLCADNLENGIVMHMSQNLDFRLSDVIRLTTANIPNTATATYNLYLKKLTRYAADMRVQGKVAAAEARLLASHRRSQGMPNRVTKIGDVIDLLPLHATKDVTKDVRGSQSTEKRHQLQHHGEDSQDNKKDELMTVPVPRKAKPTDKIIYRRLNRTQVERPTVGVSLAKDTQGAAPVSGSHQNAGQATSRDGDAAAEADVSKDDTHLREQVQLYPLTDAVTGTTATKKVDADTTLSNSSPESTQLELFLHQDASKDAAKLQQQPATHDLPPILTPDKHVSKSPQLPAKMVGAPREGLCVQHNYHPAVPQCPKKTHTQNQTNKSQQATTTVENSSQSTTSSNNERQRTTYSGPATLAYRKSVRPVTKTATVSDPITQKERGKARGGTTTATALLSSPKKVIIDLNSNEVFKRNAGKATNGTTTTTTTTTATTTTTPSTRSDWHDRKEAPQVFLYQGFNRHRTFGPRPLVKKKSVSFCESNNSENTNNADSKNLTLISVNLSTDDHKGRKDNVAIGKPVENHLITPRLNRMMPQSQGAQAADSSLPNPAVDNSKTVVFPAISPPLVTTRPHAELRD